MALFGKTAWIEEVAAVLQPLGFVRQGSVLVRQSPTIQQVVGTVGARFDNQQFWVETVLRLAPSKKRIHSITTAQGTPETIVSMRLDGIDPTVPPYFDVKTPSDWVGHLRQVLVPFLEATKTVDAMIDELKGRGGFDLTVAVVCAKTGDLEQARTLFMHAPGDRGAIKRVAARFGIRLDEPAS